MSKPIYNPENNYRLLDKCKKKKKKKNIFDVVLIVGSLFFP